MYHYVCAIISATDLKTPCLRVDFYTFCNWPSAITPPVTKKPFY